MIQHSHLPHARIACLHLMQLEEFRKKKQLDKAAKGAGAQSAGAAACNGMLGGG